MRLRGTVGGRRVSLVRRQAHIIVNPASPFGSLPPAPPPDPRLPPDLPPRARSSEENGSNLFVRVEPAPVHPAEYELRGNDDEILLALRDPAARERALHLSRRTGARFGPLALKIVVPEGDPRLAHLAERVADLVALAELLEAERGTGEAHLRALLDESQRAPPDAPPHGQPPWIQPRSAALLDLLADRFPGPQTDTLLGTLLSAPDLPLRLAAAKILGDRSVLLDLALANPGTWHAQGALAALIALDPDADLEAAIAAVLGSDDPLTLQEALASLAEVPVPSARGPLTALVVSPELRDGWVYHRTEVATALAEHLAHLGPGRDVEEALIRLLDLPSSAIRIAALRALGEVGSPAAVPHVRPLARGGWLPSGVRRAARATLAALAPSGGGELSEAGSARAGELSEADPDGSTPSGS